MEGRYYMVLDSDQNTGYIYGPDNKEWLSVATPSCDPWTSEEQDRVVKIVKLLNGDPLG